MTFLERKARITGEIPVMVVESRQMEERPKGLKPKQLEWLRDNIAAFKISERQAVEAEAHRQELREKAGLS